MGTINTKVNDLARIYLCGYVLHVGSYKRPHMCPLSWENGRQLTGQPHLSAGILGLLICLPWAIVDLFMRQVRQQHEDPA